MSAFKHKDMMLLQEAYSVTLLKEQAPHMTLEELNGRLQTMNESQLIYVTTVTNRILNEFWGQGALSGLKNIGGAAKNAGAAAAQAVKNTGSNIAQAAKNAGQTAVNVGKGVGAAASQVARNVGDMYSTGKQASQQGDVLNQAQQSIEQLTGFLRQAEESGLIKARRGATMNMTLNKIIQTLQSAQQTAQQNAQTAQQGGFTGGVGNAFKQGMSGGV